MKNSDILTAAQRVIDYAKSQGFTAASLQLIDENDDTYASPEEVAENYGDGEEIEVTVTVYLSGLTMELVGDDDDDLQITYPE